MGRRSDLDLKEQGHVRTALHYLRRRLGTWQAVGDALNCAVETAKKAAIGHDSVSARMAFRVARLLDASIDELLAGRFLAGACSRCGHAPDFADEPTFVEDRPGLQLVK